MQGAPSQRQMPRLHVPWALSQDDEAHVSENEQIYSERETGTAEGLNSRRRAVIYSDSESN